MRLNGKKIRKIMGVKGLTEEAVCSRTGLYLKSFQGILKTGFASEDAAGRIADAIGLQVGEILMPEITGNIENVIEFIKDAKTATLQFCQMRYKSRIRKLAEKYPEECQVVAENPDGTLLAHVPVEWVKIIPPRQLSEEQRKEIAERLSRTR